MTRPRCWPNNATAARDEAAMLSHEGAAEIEKFLNEREHDFTYTELLTLLSRAASKFHTIRMLMVEQGAPIRPKRS